MKRKEKKRTNTTTPQGPIYLQLSSSRRQNKILPVQRPKSTARSSGDQRKILFLGGSLFNYGGVFRGRVDFSHFSDGLASQERSDN